MCDSLVVARPGAPVWLAKNSDRHPDEVQVVESTWPERHIDEPRVSREIDAWLGRARLEALISRPHWLWGCEMGVNERGVAIGNEAVFCRPPAAKQGLTGMHMQRIALERAESAAAALALITGMLARYPQGGRMSWRGELRYSSSFLIADHVEAWVLETAGHLWAAQRVRGARTLSNMLTIEDDFDQIHPEAMATAKARGYCRGAADFGFARCFASGFYRRLTGGVQRRRATEALVAGLCARAVDAPGLAMVLQDHGAAGPASGLRMLMPCAHASWLPTRSSGQTTGSMIARLDAAGPQVWFTGSSSPCLSVFKPVSFGAADPLAGSPPASAQADAEGLWWRHERLHRATMADYSRRRAAFEGERARLQAAAWAVDPGDPAAVAAIWEGHRAALPGWLSAASSVAGRRLGPFYAFWAQKSRAAGRGAG